MFLNTDTRHYRYNKIKIAGSKLNIESTGAGDDIWILSSFSVLHVY